MKTKFKILAHMAICATTAICFSACGGSGDSTNDSVNDSADGNGDDTSGDNDNSPYLKSVQDLYLVDDTDTMLMVGEARLNIIITSDQDDATATISWDFVPQGETKEETISQTGAPYTYDATTGKMTITFKSTSSPYYEGTLSMWLYPIDETRISFQTKPTLIIDGTSYSVVTNLFELVQD